MATSSPTRVPHQHTGRNAAAATRQIVGLDLVRFAAAMLVVAFHLSYWNRVCNNGYQANYALTYLAPFSRTGWIGVHIFFVLSGFVIAYSAERSTPASFARSRFLRLYPGLWICATLTLLSLFALHEFSAGLLVSWLRSLILAPFGELIDPSFWTLGIELDFYVLVLLLLAAGWFRRLEYWITGLGTLSTVMLLTDYALERHFLAPGRFVRVIVHVLNSRSGQLLLLRHGTLFAIGVLLWLGLLQRWTVFRRAALAVCLFGGILSIRKDWADVVRVSHVPFSPVASATVWLVSVGAIVLSVIHNETLHRWLGERGARTARIFGLITYPLYLLHQRIGDALMLHLHGHVPDLLSFTLVSLLILTGSYLEVRFLERPLQDRMRGLLHGSQRKRDAPAATLP